MNSIHQLFKQSASEASRYSKLFSKRDIYSMKLQCAKSVDELFLQCCWVVSLSVQLFKGLTPGKEKKYIKVI